MNAHLETEHQGVFAIGDATRFAVASLFRDRESLEAELAMEREAAASR